MALTSEQKATMIELYRAGHSIYEIAPQVGCAPQTVHKQLVKSGEPRRTKAESTQLAFEKSGRGAETRQRRVEIAARKQHLAMQRSLAVSLYQQGQSATAIGERLGFSKVTIRNWLNAADIEMRSLEERMNLRRKHSINHDAFAVIETDAQAYWLGFLTADGGFSKHELRVNLQMGDRDHLERLRAFLDASYEVKEAHITGVSKKTGEPWERHTAYLGMSSMKLCADLWRHGVGSRKSETCRFNEQLPEHLYGAYMRGLFDGDGGYCSMVAKGAAQWRLTNNRQLLLGAQEKMVQAIGVNRTKLADHHTTPWLAYLVYSGTPQILRICHWLYQGGTVCLPRKPQRFHDYLRRFDPDRADGFGALIADALRGATCSQNMTS